MHQALTWDPNATDRASGAAPVVPPGPGGPTPMSTPPPRDPRPPAAPPAPEPAGTPTTPVERGGTIDIEGPAEDSVDESGEESFPASDPPSFSPGTGGPPDDRSPPGTKPRPTG